MYDKFILLYEGSSPRTNIISPPAILKSAICYGLRCLHKGNGTVLNTLDSLLARDKSVAGKIFSSEQEMIDDMLNIKNSKHYHQLKYLSSQHLSSVLKIRFILNPFSFLFLLAGDKKYHIIWETLNSEEATYIWHFE